MWYFGIKHTAVPCHAPSFRLIYAKHPSLMDAICNHKEAIQNWSDEIPPSCTCPFWDSSLRLGPFPTSSVNIGFLMGLCWHLYYKIDSYKLLEAFWTTRFSEQRRTTAPIPWSISSVDKTECNSMSKWWMDFTTTLTDLGRSFETNYQSFYCGYKPDSSKNSSPIAYSTMKTNELLLCEFFCPCQYFPCIDKTFLDSAIFARSSETPSDSLNITLQHLKNQFAHTYPWAMGEEKPSSWIHFAKRQKAIWFWPTYYWILQCSIQTNAKYPGKTPIPMGSTSMSKTFCTWRCLPTTETLARLCYYDGRQGSANLQSRPFWVFYQYWFWQIFFKVGICFFDSLSLPWVSTRMSFSPCLQSSRNNRGDIIKGRTFRTLNVNRHIRIGDIPDLIIAGSSDAEFSAGIQSIHSGARISNGFTSFSSLMSDGGLSLWTDLVSYPLRIHFEFTFTCIIFGMGWQSFGYSPSSTKDLPAFQILVDPHFYKAPIILETEPDQEFLGFQVELDPFELCYQPPQDLSQVLSPMSAFPSAVLLSGFASRCSIVHRGSYPQSQVDKGLYLLKRLYLSAGFKEEDFNKIVKRVLKQRSENMLMSLLTFGFLRDAIWFWISYGFSVLAQLVI